MTEVKLKCKFCNVDFVTPLKRFNYLTKNKKKSFYCSKVCFVNDTKSKSITKSCLWCKKEFLSSTHSQSKNFCTITCSSKYSSSHQDPTKRLVQFLKDRKQTIKLPPKKCVCVICGNNFTHVRIKKTCSDICSKKIFSDVGKRSSQSQKENRRSKNEILFSSLCKENFNEILTNEPMFNGWDADVIFPKLKIAVLWNGNWHYKKITKKHSVKQVQNRDNIKLDEITKMGYTSYIIKDTGSFNPKFVKQEFEKFKEWLHSTMEV